MKPDLKDAIYGLAVGDALGVPYEFRGRDCFSAKTMDGNGSHNQPAGTWSDDTSMTIAACASIKECGGIDAKNMRSHFEAWVNHGKYTPDGVVFDIGSTTATALNEKVGRSGERDNGNGSLMRILPLAFVDGVTDKQIRDVSAITHAHEISKEACVIYVRYVQKLLAGVSPKEALLDIAHKDSIFKRLQTICCLTVDDIRSTGYVVATLEAAIWCLATTENYKDCVLKAVNLGGDTDTTAAVAGGLAGILYGLDGIPDVWVDKLRRKDIIDSCLF